MSSPEGDDELMTRISAGDRDAFAALYDRLGPTVYGLALRVVRDPALAGEVSQDVFQTVWLAGGSFDAARGGARTWILTITHRRAVDAVRREHVLGRASTRGPEEQISAAPGALTVLQRTAIELAYFDGLTCAQVAERLRVPLSTASAWILDGVRRLAPATS